MDYDSDGDVASIWGTVGTQNRLYANSIHYNSAGAIERLRLGNGKWETAKYNSRLQITEIGLGNSSTDYSLLKLEYGYGSNTENNGSLRQQKISYAGLANTITQDYTYDDLNRLKSSAEKIGNNTTLEWKQTFNYDRYGNRTFDSNNTTTLDPQVSWKITNPQIQTSDNRLKKDQDNDAVNEYDYDKDGNLTLDAENQRFVYDAENRLKEFFNGGNTTSTPNAVYFYDGDGKRVKKISGTETTVFVYNAGGTLIAEYSTVQPTNAKVSYLTQDHLGSPRVITDQTGQVVSRHDYMAFGDELTETLGNNVSGRNPQHGYGAADEIRQQYTGYEKDEGGLDYAQARYYKSAHGRFTSIDPLTASASIRDPQTFNRYSYVLNSPYKFVDPLGLLAWCSTCQTTDDDFGGFLSPQNEGAGPAEPDAPPSPASGSPSPAEGEAENQQDPVEAEPPPSPAQNEDENNSENTSTNSIETNNETGDLIVHITIDIDKGTLEITGIVEGAPAVPKTIFETKIGSGIGECNNKTSCEAKKNQGPTPRGKYTIKVDELSEPSTVGAIARNTFFGDWGSFRIPLRPSKGTDTFSRSGFYIHGGDGKGTAGCIDIGGGTFGNEDTKRFIRILRSSKYNEISVTVK